MLVKLAKLIEMKRGLTRQLAELNAEAERMNLLTDRYPFAFQVRLSLDNKRGNSNPANVSIDRSWRLYNLSAQQIILMHFRKSTRK